VSDAGTVKKFMFVNRKAPYGTIYALESLEVVLIGAAFDQDVSVVFLDDGVYQLEAGTADQGHREQEFLAHLPRARGLRRREALCRAGVA
jgi:tRNA 2-thiouridine synthesizing protein C